MAALKDEWQLDVPREWMTKFNGFSLDTGGSVMKMVYRHKEDWEELKDTDKGRLRFMSFSKVDRLQALDYLQENCHVTGNTGTNPAIIFSTGMGSFQFGKSINEKFNVKLENISEMDAFVKAFHTLFKFKPIEELVYPECIAEEKAIQAYTKEVIGSFSPEDMEGMSSVAFTMSPLKAVIDKDFGEQETGVLDPDDMFPCVLAMMGSGIAFMLVNKDGSFQVVEGTNRGGRTFMAYGALMTGAMTYDELTDLAARGDPYKVHYSASDMAAEAQDVDDTSGGLYRKAGEFKEDSYIYLMGKAMGTPRDNFRKEDIAAGLLQTTATDMVQLLELLYHSNKFKRVFWCGSFIKAEVVRRYLTLEWRRRAVMSCMMKMTFNWIPSHFLKHGPYLGALGCVINSVDQFLKPPSEVAAANKAEEEKQATADQQAVDEKPADEKPADEKQATTETEATPVQPAATEKPASAKKPAVYIDGDE